MENPRSSSPGALLYQISPENRSIAVLAILYSVGIFGVLLPLHPDFILLTPVNLLISLTLVLIHHPRWTMATVLFLLFAFLWGFTAEVIGVKTGLIFGNYSYGRVLGPKLWDTPLMIGVNWAMLAYSSGVCVNYLPRLPWWIKGTLAAALMVGLDVLIEPVAMQRGFWDWEGGQVPLQNYLGWFLVALPLQLFFSFQHRELLNKVAVALFICQFVFFLVLNIFA